ncbi:MAG: murein hydrolase activator EnvC family protein [Desulfitobacterium sp.]
MWRIMILVLMIGVTLLGTEAFLKGEEVAQSSPTQSSPTLQAPAKTVSDFPSPVQGKPLRVAGEYYSSEMATMLFHPGTDFAQAEGAVIRVKHEGRVTYAGPDPFLGIKVEVDCGEDWSVIYGGLKNLRVKEGEWVQVDQAIGQIGYYPDIFGDIEQTHLHYEVWQGDLVQIP